MSLKQQEFWASVARVVQDEMRGLLCMVSLRDALALSVLLLSSGCDLKPSRYVEPHDNRATSITFANDSSLRENLVIFEGADSCTGKHAVLYVEPGATRSLSVTTTKPFTVAQSWERLEMRLTGNGSGSGKRRGIGMEEDVIYCQVFRTFQPRLGEAYSSVFKVNSDGSCSSKIAVADAPLIRVPSLDRVFVRPMTEGGSFCKPVADVNSQLERR